MRTDAQTYSHTFCRILSQMHPTHEATGADSRRGGRKPFRPVQNAWQYQSSAPLWLWEPFADEWLMRWLFINTMNHQGYSQRTSLKGLEIFLVRHKFSEVELTLKNMRKWNNKMWTLNPDNRWEHFTVCVTVFVDVTVNLWITWIYKKWEIGDKKNWI